jgi:hypothetical protein
MATNKAGEAAHPSVMNKQVPEETVSSQEHQTWLLERKAQDALNPQPIKKGVCDRRSIPHGTMLHYRSDTCVNFRHDCFYIPCHDSACPKHGGAGAETEKVAHPSVTATEKFTHRYTPADYKELRNVADEILRQVVCDCGNYRHHGVGWMPEGSGEGLSTAAGILEKLWIVAQANAGNYAEPTVTAQIPMVKRATGRTIPDLTGMEHVCTFQNEVRVKDSAEPTVTRGQESPDWMREAAAEILSKFGKVQESWLVTCSHGFVSCAEIISDHSPKGQEWIADLTSHLKRALRGLKERNWANEPACALWTQDADSDGCGACLQCLRSDIEEALLAVPDAPKEVK